MLAAPSLTVNSLSAICKGGCDHGSCLTPGTCVCDTHWAGDLCNICAPGWSDLYCETAVCTPGCKNGTCVNAPLTCSCLPQFNGTLCDTCIAGYQGVNCTTRL